MTAPDPSRPHTFAWDGISCETPGDWNLAYQDKLRGITRIRLEDDVAVRLTGEWMIPRRDAPDFSGITARFEANSREMKRVAKRSENLAQLPANWSAVLYLMEDGRRLGLAFHLAPRRALFAFFEFHLDPGPPGEAMSLIRRFIAGFAVHPPGEPRPWACYDLAFHTPPLFDLDGAAFYPGLKKFTFVRAGRRLGLSYVSLADLVLKKHPSPIAWAIAALHGDDRLRGPYFVADNGRIRARRHHFFGWSHYSEILRGCMRYEAGFRREPEHNRLVLAWYQHRFRRDLDWLAGSDFPLGS